MYLLPNLTCVEEGGAASFQWTCWSCICSRKLYLGGLLKIEEAYSWCSYATQRISQSKWLVVFLQSSPLRRLL